MAAIFVAATRQHVGKTSSCLGIVNGMKRRLDSVGFIKPVGQRHVPVSDTPSSSSPADDARVHHQNAATGLASEYGEYTPPPSGDSRKGVRVGGQIGGGLRVDKDVKLFREYFNLESKYEDMSPLVVPRGYTKAYIDGKTTDDEQRAIIVESFERIRRANPFTVVEGTGHCAVGSIINMSNAQVAALLGLKMILVVNGGLGSAFDELSLNLAACERAGADIAGVLVNKIHPGKMDVVRDYFGRALKDRYGIPLVGCVPYGEMMDAATFLDFEHLFGTRMAAGQQHRLRHFAEHELAITDLNLFLEKLHKGDHNDTLFVTHASRSDIVTGYLVYAAAYEKFSGESLRGGILLAGSPTKPFGAWPDKALRKCIDSSNIPVLFTHVSTSETVSMLEKYTAKLNADDPTRTDAVVEHYTEHINHDLILEIAGYKG